MSALPPKADMDQHARDVRFVPKADIMQCSKESVHSITSSPEPIREADIGSKRRKTRLALRGHAQPVVDGRAVQP
jgi:hypothetical protein